MAYRPPSQSRYAAITAPPPPGPFSGRRQQPQQSQQSQQPQEDDWITPRKRQGVYPPAPAPTPVTTPTPSIKSDDFPTLGAPSMPKKTWGSNESMAERMKKKMEEEELERLEKEKRKEAEKKNTSTTQFIPTNIITHQNLMRRFKEEDENVYEDDYEGGLDKDGYGYEYANYEYGAHTPEYSDEVDEEDGWS